jgi:hypothetical protein
MRIRILAAMLLLAAAACSNPLDVQPTTSIPDATAISDGPSAQAALTGAYNGLQSLSLYGEELVELGDLSADNALNSGTYTSYAEVDQNQLHANNTAVADIWLASYDDINRANEIITRVPAITSIDPDQATEILGEAYFLRALNYSNLVKLYGGVPIVTQPATTLSAASSVTRASVDEVYDQILKDLDSAAAGISNTDETTQATVGAVAALRARVLLYKGDWAGAEAAAADVESMGYELAPRYQDLYSATGNATPEDIFRIIQTEIQESFLSYDYFTRGLGGVYELAPTPDLMHAYDPAFDPNGPISAYNPTDRRGQWNISIAGSRAYGSKYRSIVGTEYFPVLRFAEMILTRAEALARLGQLSEAVDEYNRVRERAGLPDDILGVTVIGPGATTLSTQDQVIARILNERRLELAFEGDRWPDLVRTGLATTVMGISAQATLYPIPQREVDVAPGITQNPGY